MRGITLAMSSEKNEINLCNKSAVIILRQLKKYLLKNRVTSNIHNRTFSVPNTIVFVDVLSSRRGAISGLFHTSL